MKKRPKLKCYPNGGTPPAKQYSLDEYNALLAKYPNINPTDPKSAGDVKQYVGNYITPNLKGYQAQLNTALRNKYKLAADAPITNQYLSPEEADKALNGKYADYMANFDAYQGYRAKTPQMPARDVEGTITEDPKVYGKRHVNLFQPYTTNTVTPSFAMGGTKKRLPKFTNGYEWNPADPNRTDNYIPEDQSNSGMYSDNMGYTYGLPEQPMEPVDNRNTGQKVQGSMGWMQYAQAAKGVVKGAVPRDENGMPISNTGKAVDQFSEESHKTAMNEAKEGDAMGAVREITGFGKISRGITNLAGKGQEKNGFWGKVNKANDNQYYSYDQYNQPQYPMGGPHMGMPNAEVEKEEVMQMPNGQTVQVDGPTHAQGGVDVNIPGGTRIFSDRLKLPGSKKTIAKEAEAYKTKKEDKVLADNSASKIARASAALVAEVKQKKLDQLFQAQEALKMSKVAKYAERMGVSLPQSQGEQFSKGGAKKYYGGGIKPDEIAENIRLAKLAQEQESAVDNSFADAVDRDINTGVFNSPNAPYINGKPNPNYNPAGTKSTLPMDSDTESEYDPTSRNVGESAFNMIAQNAGNIWDLYQSRGGKKYDKEDYGVVTPTYLDPTQALIDADIQNSMTANSIKGAVNGNAGAYLSNRIAAGSMNTLNKARIRQDYQNKNAEIANYAKYYNKGNEIAGKTATSQNKARSEDMAAHAIRDIGSKSASAYKDYKLNDMDTKKMAIINQYFPNYKFDPETYEMYFRAATSGKTKPKSKTKPRAKSGVGYTAE